MAVWLLLTLLMGQAATTTSAPASGQTLVPAPAPEVTATPVPDVEVVAVAREGSVELECTVERDGRVSNCIVRSETPRGFGFGEAALNAARRARLSPRTVDGVATGGKIRFRTTFRIPD